MGVLDKAWFPILVCGSKIDLLECESPGVGLMLVVAALLKTDVYVHHFELQVVDDLFTEPGHHSIFLFLLVHLLERRLQHFSYFFEYFILLAPDR